MPKLSVLEFSRELAVELGYDLPEPWQPHPAIAEGILETAWTPSESRLASYYLVRTPSGWCHTSTTCRGWTIRGKCKHVSRRNKMTTETKEMTVTNPAALIAFDQLEDEQLLAHLEGNITRAWAYELTWLKDDQGQPVRGVSAAGAEECSEEMAHRGMALRPMDIKVEYEDEEEARLLVQVGRYAVFNDDRPDKLLDCTIRAKRQPKKMKLRTGAIIPDGFWYEKGVTKAVRNAKLALMDSATKAYIISKAIEAGRVLKQEAPAPGVATPRQSRVAAPPASEPSTASALTPEASTAISKAIEALRVKHGAPAVATVTGEAAKRWPAAVHEGRFRWASLSAEGAEAWFNMLEEAFAADLPVAEGEVSLPVT